MKVIKKLKPATSTVIYYYHVVLRWKKMLHNSFNANATLILHNLRNKETEHFT